MQTTWHFFYGTNWSLAANSGQRGPWSYPCGREQYLGICINTPFKDITKIVYITTAIQNTTPLCTYLLGHALCSRNSKVPVVFQLSSTPVNGFHGTTNYLWVLRSIKHSVVHALDHIFNIANIIALDYEHYYFDHSLANCSPVNSPHKGQWRRALMFSLICAWINS